MSSHDDYVLLTILHGVCQNELEEDNVIAEQGRRIKQKRAEANEYSVEARTTTLPRFVLCFFHDLAVFVLLVRAFDLSHRVEALREARNVLIGMCNLVGVPVGTKENTYMLLDVSTPGAQNIFSRKDCGRKHNLMLWKSSSHRRAGSANNRCADTVREHAQVHMSLKQHGVHVDKTCNGPG